MPDPVSASPAKQVPPSAGRTAEERADPLYDAHCEKCDRARGENRIEHVAQGQVERPGWQCVCGWWNWLDVADRSSAATPPAGIPDVERALQLGESYSASPDRGHVAYVENLAAQEAMYWEARRQGMNLTDKQVGDLLRAAASASPDREAGQRPAERREQSSLREPVSAEDLLAELYDYVIALENAAGGLMLSHGVPLPDVGNLGDRVRAALASARGEQPDDA